MFQTTILIATIIAIIVSFFFYANNHYSKMLKQCNDRGGQFYSITFHENICIDNHVVIKLD